MNHVLPVIHQSRGNVRSSAWSVAAAASCNSLKRGFASSAGGRPELGAGIFRTPSPGVRVSEEGTRLNFSRAKEIGGLW